MTRTRFVTTVGALAALFAGGGYVVNQLSDGPSAQITLPAPTTGTQQSSSGDTVPNAGTSEGIVTAPAGGTAATTSEAPAAGTVETQMKKEFDTAAADAAAEAEVANSGSTTAASSATRSVSSESELVTASLDTVQLSATGVSVIAGQAQTGTTVTLLGNDQELATTVTDESGAWTMIIDEPLAPGTYKLKLKAVGSKGGDVVIREVGEETVKAPEAIASAEGSSTDGTTASTGAASDKAAAPATGEAEATTAASGASSDASSTAASKLPASSKTDAVVELDVTVPEPNAFDVASVPPDLATPPAIGTEAAPVEPVAPSAETTTSQSDTGSETAEVEAAAPTAETSTEPAETSTPATPADTSTAETPTAAEPAAPAAESTAKADTTAEPAVVPAPAESSMNTSSAESSAATDPATASSGSSDSVADATETAQATTTDPALADQAGEAAQSLSDMFTDWLTATGDQAAEAAKTFSLTGATYKPVAKDKGVVTLSGRGPPNAEVRVFVDTVAVGVTKVAETGRWLAEADHWIAPGAHSARAEIIGNDGAVLAGHDLAFASQGLPETVADAGSTPADEAAAPPPVLLAIADVAYENMGPKMGRITVGGRAEPKSKVNVFTDGTGIGTAEAAESGDWSLASDTWIDIGAHAIRAERVTAGGEVVESTLTEFVRPPAEIEVAAAETPSVEAEAEPEAATHVPQKRKKRRLAKSSRKAKLARSAHRKRMAALAGARKAKLAKARGPKLKTVTVQRGNAAVRFKVPIGKRKRRVLGYLHLGGTGWYRVRRGDTLWRIANRCYGDGRHYPRIVASNARAIRNPDLIYPRQRLYIP